MTNQKTNEQLEREVEQLKREIELLKYRLEISLQGHAATNKVLHDVLDIIAKIEREKGNV